MLSISVKVSEKTKIINWTSTLLVCTEEIVSNIEKITLPLQKRNYYILCSNGYTYPFSDLEPKIRLQKWINELFLSSSHCNYDDVGSMTSTVVVTLYSINIVYYRFANYGIHFKSLKLKIAFWAAIWVLFLQIFIFASLAFESYPSFPTGNVVELVARGLV